MLDVPIDLAGEDWMNSIRDHLTIVMCAGMAVREQVWRELDSRQVRVCVGLFGVCYERVC